MAEMPHVPRDFPVLSRREVADVRRERDEARDFAFEIAGLWLGIELAERRGADTSLQRVRLAAKCRRLMLEDWT